MTELSSEQTFFKNFYVRSMQLMLIFSSPIYQLGIIKILKITLVNFLGSERSFICFLMVFTLDLRPSLQVLYPIVLLYGPIEAFINRIQKKLRKRTRKWMTWVQIQRKIGEIRPFRSINDTFYLLIMYDQICLRRSLYVES